MLLAVEGGGFFSSSASGYTNGLILLILGRRNEERPMRVSPWNQYQLVEHDVGPDPHLASKKNQASGGCTSFICFNCTSAGLDGPAPPKMGHVHKSETSSSSDTSLSSDNSSSAGFDGSAPPKIGHVHQSETLSSSDTSSSERGKVTTNTPVDENKKKACLKSSLKKQFTECSVTVEGDDARDSLEEAQSNISCCTQRRKVQWTDACGRELAEIREFELSEGYISDDELERGVRRCECVIQ